MCGPLLIFSLPSQGSRLALRLMPRWPCPGLSGVSESLLVIQEHENICAWLEKQRTRISKHDHVVLCVKNLTFWVTVHSWMPASHLILQKIDCEKLILKTMK